MFWLLSQLYIYFWIIISILLLIGYLRKKELTAKLINKLIIIWPIITFIQLAITNLIIYFQWKNHFLLRHLLPPESNYLFESIKKNDLMGYLTTIIVGALVTLILIFIAKRSQEKFLKFPEASLVFLGVLIVGWSNTIVFIFSIFVFNLFGYIFLMAFKKIKAGAVIYPTPFILLAIIFTLLIGYKLSYLTGLY